MCTSVLPSTYLCTVYVPVYLLAGNHQFIKPFWGIYRFNHNQTRMVHIFVTLLELNSHPTLTHINHGTGYGCAPCMIS